LAVTGIGRGDVLVLVVLNLGMFMKEVIDKCHYTGIVLKLPKIDSD
jgi:hypothetical protein